MLARLLQPVEVTDFRHLAGQASAGFRRLLYFSEVTDRLFGRDGTKVGLARLGGQPRHLQCRHALGLGEVAFLDLHGKRHGDQRKQVEGQHLFDLEFTYPILGTTGAKHRKMRVRQAPGLDHLGFADPKIVECGAESPVVVNGDLNSILSRQGLGQQLDHTCIDLLAGLVAPDPLGIGTNTGAGRFPDGVEASVRGEAGTAAQNQRSKHQGVQRLGGAKVSCG